MLKKTNMKSSCHSRIIVCFVIFTTGSFCMTCVAAKDVEHFKESLIAEELPVKQRRASSFVRIGKSLGSQVGHNQEQNGVFGEKKANSLLRIGKSVSFETRSPAHQEVLSLLLRLVIYLHN